MISTSSFPPVDNATNRPKRKSRKGSDSDSDFTLEDSSSDGSTGDGSVKPEVNPKPKPSNKKKRARKKAKEKTATKEKKKKEKTTAALAKAARVNFRKMSKDDAHGPQTKGPYKDPPRRIFNDVAILHKKQSTQGLLFEQTKPGMT